MFWRRRLRWLERGALLVGLLLLGLWSRDQVRSWAFQSAESNRLLDSTREAGPGPATVAGIAAASRDSRAESEAVLGRIEIPRLRIQAIVAEGTDERTLERAVGHVTSTAPPGSPGNCGLAGHRDTFFRGLGRVRADDLVRFVTPECTLTYKVDWSRVVEPRRVDMLDSTSAPSLTLVTCYPFRFVGRAPQRFVVRARQIEAAKRTRVRDRTAIASTVLMAAGR